MNSTPRVSVIIPAYNSADYLPEALESVLRQDYNNYEIIVIDDGSKDHTFNCVKPYKDQIRYFYQENQGVSKARNHGIEVACGEFVAFLDADDFFLPHKLEAQLAVFDTNPELGIVHSGWRRVNHQGQFLTDVQPWHYVPELNLESWLIYKPVLPSAMIFRREWLEKSGGFDPRFPPAEDTELVLRLARMGCQASWLKSVTVGYRQHDQSAMHQGLPQARSLMKVIDNFFAQPNLPEKVQWLEQSVRYTTLVWIAWYLYQTNHLPEMVEILKRSQKYQSLSPIELLVNWIDSFSRFSADIQEELDTDALTQSQQWQEFTQWLLKE